MASFDINKRNVFQDNGYNFIAIGDPQKLFGSGGLVNTFKKKILGQGKDADTSGFWATLGRKDNGQILDRWSGTISCSRNGNQDFTNKIDLVTHEIRSVQDALKGQALPDAAFTERFISLENLRFSNVPGANELRLTLMVKPNEQAMVFIQHTLQEDAVDEKTASGVMQILVPESPEDLGKRDRLTYYFDVPNVIGAVNTRFVLKVLTFPRQANPAVSDADVKSVFKGLDNPYGFTKYIKRADGKMIYTPIDPKDIDRTKRTIFLFHGTFSSVQGSYGQLLLNNWCQEVIDKGVYEQIIGFDHYTMIESPMQNAAMFYSMLTPGGKFTKPAVVITTSRGGLVGKCVLNDPNQKLITYERAATVACANGVEYFTVAEKLGKFLSAMRDRVPEISTKLILAVLEFGIQKFVGQPGLRIMKKDDPDLAKILAAKPANPNLRYYPLCGDYKFDPNRDEVSMKILSYLIDEVMNNKFNDWVVETDFQVIMPAGYLAYGKPVSFFRNQPINSIHVKYFDVASTTETKKRIFDYFHDTNSVL